VARPHNSPKQHVSMQQKFFEPYSCQKQKKGREKNVFRTEKSHTDLLGNLQIK